MNKEIKKKNKIKFDLSKIKRLEVINHAENSHEKGRIIVLYERLGHFKDVDISIQDDEETLKIFLS